MFEKKSINQLKFSIHFIWSLDEVVETLLLCNFPCQVSNYYLLWILSYLGNIINRNNYTFLRKKFKLEKVIQAPFHEWLNQSFIESINQPWSGGNKWVQCVK